MRSGVARLRERQAFEVTMASRVHPEESHRSEGLLQSVQGQRAGYPQPIVFSFVSFLEAGIWACE